MLFRWQEGWPWWQKEIEEKKAQEHRKCHVWSGQLFIFFGILSLILMGTRSYKGRLTGSHAEQLRITIAQGNCFPSTLISGWLTCCSAKLWSFYIHHLYLNFFCCKSGKFQYPQIPLSYLNPYTPCTSEISCGRDFHRWMRMPEEKYSLWWNTFPFSQFNEMCLRC